MSDLLSAEQAFFLHSTNSLGTELEPQFFAFDYDGLCLQIRLPYFFGMALREADVVAKLLAFARDITFLHEFILTQINS